MSGPSHRTVEANGISMHVVEQGTGPPVVLCHGFPELSFSWRHQMEALAGAGYRALAPDQRGYGLTDRPDAVAAYDIDHLTGDMAGLLDALEEERAVFVGHDWGSIVAWHMPLLQPDRVRAVVGMSVPFVPRLPARPTRLMRMAFRDRFFYILYFQQTGPADEELARDPQRTLRSVFWSLSGEAPRGSIRDMPRGGTGWLDTLAEPPGSFPWMDHRELDVYVSKFSQTGFTGGLNWYRNLDRNWELTEPFAAVKVTVPALFVAGERDVVLRMAPPSLMEGWVMDLRGSALVPDAGHWVQQERPEEVNRALLEFLAGIPDA
jgi:pimeloyl-ACP methyl ester carboxylesterase